MKTAIFAGSKGRITGAAGLALLLAGAAGRPTYAAQAGDVQPVPAPLAAYQTPSATVHPWVADVVRMADSGVGQDIIESYVKSSTMRSSLTADDIIYLRNHGLSNGIITAMIERGNTAAATAMASAPPQVAPVQTYSPPTQPYYQPPVSYDDSASAPVVYPDNYYYDYYNYGYPYYYNYPYYYSPFVSFIGPGFRDRDRFFHGDRDGRFHQGSRFVGSGRSSWSTVRGGVSGRSFSTPRVGGSAHVMGQVGGASGGHSGRR